jgi:hypothetical protein
LVEVTTWLVLTRLQILVVVGVVVLALELPALVAQVAQDFVQSTGGNRR